MQKTYTNSVLLIVLLSLILINFTRASDEQFTEIIGATTANQNETKTYTYNSNFLVPGASWEVTGGTITSSSIDGTLYSATVTWTTVSTSNTIKLKRMTLVLGQLTVNVSAAVPTLNPGSISGGGTFCYNSSVSLTNGSSPSGGVGGFVYQWQRYYNSSWTNVGTNSASYTFSPTFNASYRRKVTSGLQIKYSNTKQVNVYGQLTAGSISGAQTICPGTANTLTNASSPGGGTGTAIYGWQKSSNNSHWSNVSGNSNSIQYSPGTVNSTTYFRRGFKNSCSSTFIYTSSVKVTTLSQMTAPVAYNGSRCGTGSITLSVDTRFADQFDSYNWFENETGGTSLGYGSSFSTPSISSTTTYYVSVHNETSTLCESNRTAVTATINPLPTSSPTTIGGSRCGSGTATLTASGGSSYKWYASSSSTTVLSSSNTYSPTVSSTTTFYAALVNSNGCIGPRKATIATVNAFPSAPAASDITRCGRGTVTLTASGTPSDGSYKWYGVASGGSVLGSSPIFTTSHLNTSTSYWVSAVSNSGCEGVREEVITTIIPQFPAPVPLLSLMQNCGTQRVPISVVATNEPGDTYTWFTDSIGGTVLDTGPSYITPTISTSTTYYVSIHNETSALCESKRMAVTANIEAIPSPPTAILNEAVVLNSSTVVTFLVNNDAGQASDYYWFDNPYITEDEIATGLSYSSTIGNATQFYSRIINNQGCFSDPIEFTAWLVNKPEIITVGLPEVTAASPITLKTELGLYDTYSWQLNGAEFAATPSVSINTPGEYTVVVGVDDDYATSKKLNIANALFTVGNNYNFIQSIGVRKEGVANLGEVLALGMHDINNSLTYFDGLGRAEQSIAVGASPQGFDMVQTAVYGDYGRANKQYLPYVSTTSDGKYKTDAFDHTDYTQSGQYQYYQTGAGITHDTIPYAEVTYDDTPYQRVIEQAAPGEQWKMETGHTIKTAQRLNTTADNVRKWSNDATSTTTYSAGEILVQSLTDEHGVTSYSFTDAQGRKVLKRQPFNGTVDGANVPFLDTYYVYDELGRITHIIQPKAVAKMATSSYDITASESEGLVFTFVYDNKNRLLERKVPGRGAEYIVYDPYNRPILSQNALMRADNKWNYVKYDRQHRPVEFGLYTDAGTLTQMQTTLDALDFEGGTDLFYEVKDNAGTHGYSNLAFPSTNIEVLSVNYYDNYDTNVDGTADYSYQNQSLGTDEPLPTTRLQGLPTATKTKVLGSSDWITAAYFYDKYGRVIQTQSSNNFLTGGVSDVATAVYNWQGQLLQSISKHTVGAETITQVYEYDFDDTGRPTATYHTLNDQDQQLISSYAYNELGQLIEKNLHGNDTETEFLQSVDLQYNIRGWLTNINNEDLEAGGDNDYFGLELMYTSTSADNAQFNGNISAMRWSKAGQKAQMYNYDYYDNNSLNQANHKTKGLTWATGKVDLYSVKNIGYDHNGNITGMDRYAKNEAGNAGLIDELDYSYTNNRLMAVADASTKADGFDQGTATTNAYDYDANGNLTKDVAKDITGITYNYLDKPTQISFGDGRSILNTYDATGNRAVQQTFDTGGSPELKTTYLGAYLYQNEALHYIQHSEGRIVPVIASGGEAISYIYQYHLTDHQGNVRMTLTTEQRVETYLATMEFEYRDYETATFNNVEETDQQDQLNNHTLADASVPIPAYSARLNSVQTQMIGPAKSIRIFPGDTVSIASWAKFNSYNGNGSKVMANSVLTAIAGAFTPVGASSEVVQQILNQFTMAGAGAISPGAESDAPAAYLNYLIFDNDYELTQSGFASVGTNAEGVFEYLEIPDIAITDVGYMYIYVSNEDASDVNVFFDDLMITHKHGPIIQSDEYYPFGLQANSSYSIADIFNNRLFNAGSELNSSTNNYETFYRNYDPALGRFNGIDIKATSYSSTSPYVFANNDPVYYNDPLGDTYLMDNPDWQVEWESDVSSGGRSGGGPHYGSSSGRRIMPGSDNHWSDEFNTGFGGGYSSTSAMIADAWNSTNAGNLSVSTYSSGYLTSFTQTDNYAVWGDMNGNGGFVGVTNTGLISRTIGTGRGSYYAFGKGHHSYDGGGIKDGSGLMASVGNTFIQSTNIGLGYFVADAIRYTPMWGNTPNPYFMAEAAFADFGGIFVGAEMDIGSYFILTGDLQGQFIGYDEIAGGAAPEAGFGFEFGRIDMFGRDTNSFGKEHLKGDRSKVWGSAGIIGSAGFGYAWSSPRDGSYVQATSVSIGLSLDFGFSLGYNFGTIR